MANKQNDFYFENFRVCAACSCEAAQMLKSSLASFDAASLKHKVDGIHVIEHNADVKKHEMMAVLVKAFITPIERDDIIKLSQTIDDVTDAIEDILIHVYITNIQTIRPDVYCFVDLLIKSCELLTSLLDEFRDFKKSKELLKIIIELNRLEEEGDKLYLDAMHNLYTNSADPLEIVIWRQIYTYFEKAFDCCEDVANIVESITIENI